MFANFRYQFINVVMRKVSPAPFLIVEGLTRNQGEKPQRIHWTQAVAQRLNGLATEFLLGELLSHWAVIPPTVQRRSRCNPAAFPELKPTAMITKELGYGFSATTLPFFQM